MTTATWTIYPSGPSRAIQGATNPAAKRLPQSSRRAINTRHSSGEIAYVWEEIPATIHTLGYGGIDFGGGSHRAAFVGARCFLPLLAFTARGMESLLYL